MAVGIGGAAPRALAKVFAGVALVAPGALASAMPAGLTLGQTSTHLPHLVQASSMRSTRPLRAVSKEISFIACRSSAEPMQMRYQMLRFKRSLHLLRRKC